jgi:hypothetical protein
MTLGFLEARDKKKDFRIRLFKNIKKLKAHSL